MTNAEKLKKYKDDHGLTLEALAEKCTLGVRTIQRVLDGKKSQRFTIDTINENLGLDLAYCDLSRVKQHEISNSFLPELEILVAEGFIKQDGDSEEYVVVREDVTEQNATRPMFASILLALLVSKKQESVSYVLACLTGVYGAKRIDRYAPILGYIQKLFASCSLSTYQKDVDMCCKAILSDLSLITSEQNGADTVLSNLRTAYENRADDNEILASLQAIKDWLCTHWFSIDDYEAKSRIMSYLSIALDNATDTEATRKMLFHAILKSYFMVDLARLHAEESENGDIEETKSETSALPQASEKSNITLPQALKMWWNGRHHKI